MTKDIEIALKEMNDKIDSICRFLGISSDMDKVLDIKKYYYEVKVRDSYNKILMNTHYRLEENAQKLKDYIMTYKKKDLGITVDITKENGKFYSSPLTYIMSGNVIQSKAHLEKKDKELLDYDKKAFDSIVNSMKKTIYKVEALIDNIECGTMYVTKKDLEFMKDIYKCLGLFEIKNSKINIEKLTWSIESVDVNDYGRDEREVYRVRRLLSFALRYTKSNKELAKEFIDKYDLRDIQNHNEKLSVKEFMNMISR